jgi:cullin 1
VATGSMADHVPTGLVEGWAQIKSKAVDVLVDQLKRNFDIGARPFDNKAFVEVYTVCYNLCTQRAPNNFSEQLYGHHGHTMTSYLGEHVLPALRSKSGPELLGELIVRWNSHKIMNKWLKKFFAYLDRYYVKHHSHKSLHEVGVTAFKSEVYLNTKEAVVEAMLGAIERERLGEEVDHSQLKSCVAVFEVMGEGTLDQYIHDFQDPLLTASDSFYNSKSSEWMASDDTPTYLKKAEAALKAEVQRVKDYLIGHETESKLLSVCEKQLLEVPQKELLERPSGGCASLLKDDKVDDLKRMFALFE